MNTQDRNASPLPWDSYINTYAGDNVIQTKYLLKGVVQFTWDYSFDGAHEMSGTITINAL